MPNWKEVLEEIQAERAKGNLNALDLIRRRYLLNLSELTGRNVIAYYSGWLQRNTSDVIVNDKDKNAFMVTIHRMDKSKGLDIIFHTPGGDLAATESIVDYWNQIFGNNIRAIIPQISMSAGTMMALSCREIIMGKHSNLGPIDPQMGGIACQAVLAEFKKAVEDITRTPQSAPLWQSIISKYHPTFLGACKNAIDWSEELAREWLLRNMCQGDEERTARILREFSDHDATKSHARHISKERCKEIGVNVVDLEEDQELQDAVLTVHHAFMHTFSQTPSTKIVENQMGVAFIESMPLPTHMIPYQGVPQRPAQPTPQPAQPV